MNLNKAQVIGRLTRDPELRALPSGMQVATFSMASNRSYKNKEGKQVEETDFHNIAAFGRQAEILAQYVKKGQMLFVEGRMKTQSWEKDGKKNYRMEIIVENFQFGPKASGTAETKSEMEDRGIDTDAEDINPEDIPF